MKSKKNKYISDKIRELMAENRPQDQAIAIALSMANEKFKSGGEYLPMYEDGGGNPFEYKSPFSTYNLQDYMSTQNNNTNSNNNMWLPGNIVTNSKFGNITFGKSSTTQKPIEKKKVKNTTTGVATPAETTTKQDGSSFYKGMFNQPSYTPPADLGFNQGEQYYGLGRDKNYVSAISPKSLTASEDWTKNNPLPQGVISKELGLETPLMDKYTEENLKNNESKSSTQQDPIQFFNPYGGVDLNSAASIFGQSLQSGDALSGIASGLKLATGLGRNFMGGFAAGKAREEAIADYEKNRRNAMTGAKNPTALGQDGGTFFAQEGGEMQQNPMLEQILMMLQQGATPEQILQQLISSGVPQEEAIQAIQMVMQSAQQNAQAMPQEEVMMQEGGMFNQPEVPEQMANAEIEDGEYVRDRQGIKYAEGEKHNNGGIPTQLENGAQVLSDFKKVGKELAKQLSEQLGVKVRPTDTFASVLDKYDIKSEYKETQEEIEEKVKKISEQEKKVKHDATLALNKQVLSEEIEEEMQELSEMEVARQQVFDLLFQSQEATKAQETQQGNFMRDGGTIRDLMTKYNISEEDAKTLIPNYQGIFPSTYEQPIDKFGNPTTLPQYVSDATTLGKMTANIPKYTEEEKKIIKDSYAKIIKDKQSLQTLYNAIDTDSLVYNPGMLKALKEGKKMPLELQHRDTPKGTFGAQDEARLNGYLYNDVFKRLNNEDFDPNNPEHTKKLYDVVTTDLKEQGVQWQGSPFRNKETEGIGNVNMQQPLFVKSKEASQQGQIDLEEFRKASPQEKEAISRVFNVPVVDIEDIAKNSTNRYLKFTPSNQVAPKDTDTTQTPPTEVPLTPEQAVVAEEEKKRRLNMMLLPDQTPMQPWGMLPPAMTTQTIYAPKYNEIDPQEQLMEIQRNKLNTLVGIQNLPDSQQAASALALDANTNMATNKVMTETDRYNAMARERTEGAEAMQKTQQSQANIVGLQQYQQLLGQELEANEADWRNFYNRLSANNMNNWETINRVNAYNAFNPNIQNTGNGFVVQNVVPKTTDASS